MQAVKHYRSHPGNRANAAWLVIGCHPPCCPCSPKKTPRVGGGAGETGQEGSSGEAAPSQEVASILPGRCLWRRRLQYIFTTHRILEILLLQMPQVASSHLLVVTLPLASAQCNCQSHEQTSDAHNSTGACFDICTYITPCFCTQNSLRLIPVHFEPLLMAFLFLPHKTRAHLFFSLFILL